MRTWPACAGCGPPRRPRLPRVPPPELASTGRDVQPRGPALLRVPSHPVFKPVGCGAEGREALTIGTGTWDRATEGARAGRSTRPVSPHGCRLPPRRGPLADQECNAGSATPYGKPEGLRPPDHCVT